MSHAHQPSIAASEPVSSLRQIEMETGDHGPEMEGEMRFRSLMTNVALVFGKRGLRGERGTGVYRDLDIQEHSNIQSPNPKIRP